MCSAHASQITLGKNQFNIFKSEIESQAFSDEQIWKCPSFSHRNPSWTWSRLDMFNLVIYRLKMLREVIETTVTNATTGCEHKRKKLKLLVHVLEFLLKITF